MIQKREKIKACPELPAGISFQSKSKADISPKNSVPARFLVPLPVQ
jgi:hypothetical protein